MEGHYRKGMFVYFVKNLYKMSSFVKWTIDNTGAIKKTLVLFFNNTCVLTKLTLSHLHNFKICTFAKETTLF